MSGTMASTRWGLLPLSIFRLRMWHVMLLTAYVAIAIVDIQCHARPDPVLIGLACVGFTGLAVLGWLLWLVGRKVESRIGRVPMIVMYLVAMGALYLVATLVYVAIEGVYVAGSF